MLSDLKIVYEPNGAGSQSIVEHKIDIVFVHGLNPKGDPNHAEKTWTHENGTLWPKDLLPKRIPYARVILFTYNSNVAWDVSELGIRQHANALLDVLQGEMEDTDRTAKPVLFVSHSLGVLVIKQALLHAKNNDRVYGSIRESTKALVFFATPHRGGNGTTLGQIAVNTVTFFTGNSSNDLVESLRKNSKFLAHLSADFQHQYEDYSFLSIVEKRGMIHAPFRTIIVESSSAIIGLAGHREHVLELDRNHSQICKLAQDSEFNWIARHIKRLADSSIKAMTPEAGRNTNVVESIDSHPSSSGAAVVTRPAARPPLFSTLDFRQKEDFVGQDLILRELETFLYSKQKKLLVLHGAAGTGKSSTVFEFASRIQDAFSVFWFSAESSLALEEGFNRASRKLNPEKFRTYLRNHEIVVREWLQDEANGKWLLILDDADPDVEFTKWIPQVGWGKTIVTSRSPSVTKGTTVVVKLEPLSPAQAVDLLLMKHNGRRGLDQSWDNVSPLLPIAKALCDRPQAITLAASCIASIPTVSAAEHLLMLHEEESEGLSAPHESDPKIAKWLNFVLENSTTAEYSVLLLIAMFDRKWISDEFLDFLRAAAATESMVGQHKLITHRTLGPAIRRLTSFNLLEQHIHVVSQYFHVPRAIWDCLQAKFENLEQAYVLADAGCTLLCEALKVKYSSSSKEFRCFMGELAPHCRALSLFLTPLSGVLPPGMPKNSLTISEPTLHFDTTPQ